MQEEQLNSLVVVEQLPVIKQQLKIISDEVEKKIEYALSLECTEESKNEVKKKTIYKRKDTQKILCFKNT